MLDSLRKQQLVNLIIAMKDNEPRRFSDFKPEEAAFILHKIKTQTGKFGFEITTNGTAEKPESITKYWKTTNW